jgi:hypothetical protein
MTIDYTRLIEQLDPEQDGEDTLKPRTAIVDEVNSDGTLDIILSGVIVPNVPRLASVGAIEGDAVQVQVSRGSMLVVGTIASVSTPHLPSSGSISAIATTGGALNDSTSNTFVNLGGTGSITSFSFTKRYSDSRIKVDMRASGYCITNLSIPEFGVLINGVDTAMFTLPAMSATSQRQANSAVKEISGVPAGVHTIQGRWRRSTGTGTIRRDGGDWLTISALEVSA